MTASITLKPASRRNTGMQNRGQRLGNGVGRQADGSMTEALREAGFGK